MKRFLLHSFLLICSCTVAQTIHYSQFNENHALINPALTGATDPLRASVSYRDQWRSVNIPYKTFGISMETQTNTSGWKKVDNFRGMTFKERTIGRIAWGLSVYNDRAGSGTLATTLGNLSMASFVPVNKNHFLSFGVQGSVGQKSVLNGNLIFPSQFNGLGYDPNLPQNERVSSASYAYFGFSAGCLWSYGQYDRRVASTRQVRANAGLAFYQVIVPKENFFSDNQLSYNRYVLHGELLYVPSDFNMGFNPSFIVQAQGSSMEIIAGSLFKYYISDNSKYTGNVKRSSFGFGLYYRNNDAFIAMINFEKSEQYVIGLSYDINTSKLYKVSSGMGSFEITLRYTPPKAFLYQKKVKLEKN